MNGKNTKGIVLEQLKEPALSREIRYFLNTIPDDLIPSFENLKSKLRYTLDDVMQVAQEANIVDERDGKTVYSKLLKARKKGVSVIVADAIDDEPYVSSQMSPMLHLSQAVVGGLNILTDAFEEVDSYIAVYKNIYDLNTKVPKEIDGVRIEKIEGRYPVEYRAVRNLGKNCLVIGTCALVHLYRAFREGQKQSSCFITVAGNCVANPINLEVSIGLTVQEVLERCGLIEDPTRIIIGGPMTGVSILHPEQTVITPSTRAVLAFKEDIKERSYVCIGCGNCVHYCPQDLNPMWIYKLLSKRKADTLTQMDIHMCIGCGICSYVCPAKLDLSLSIYATKRKLQEYEEEEGM